MTDEVERRLRGALLARAGQITQERLRFGVPPTVAVPRARARWWRWLPVPVAVAAAVLGFTLMPGPAEPEPVLPGGPAVTTPSSGRSAPVPAPTATESVPSTPSASSTPTASTGASPSTSAAAKPATSAPAATGPRKPDDGAAPTVAPGTANVGPAVTPRN